MTLEWLNFGLGYPGDGIAQGAGLSIFVSEVHHSL
jgi:hypothetical protein